MTDLLTCFARGHDGHWEAICLDLNIAAQGESFQEVKNLLSKSIETYVEDVMNENDTATRQRLLSRQAPLLTRLYWTVGFALANVAGRHAHRAGKRDENAAFAVPCHA